MSEKKIEINKDSNTSNPIELDARGLYCPEPVMLLHNKILDIKAGQVLRITATDPSTSRDIPKFCAYLGHDLVAQNQNGEFYVYDIRKKQK